MTWDPLDIEELHKQAETHTWCPYYATKDRAHAADIIFMPYNYLIDEKIRESYEIKFENSLLIFDEAHNVPQAQEDVTSFELRARIL
jgi:regulator of telomere elongation helicase 1